MRLCGFRHAQHLPGVQVQGVPVDAFARPDQAAYLDFLDGVSTGQRALDASDLVVVRDGSPPQRLVERAGGWSEAARLDDWLVYTRR